MTNKSKKNPMGNIAEEMLSLGSKPVAPVLEKKKSVKTIEKPATSRKERPVPSAAVEIKDVESEVLTITIPKAAKKKLKLHSVMEEIDLVQIGREALNLYAKKHGLDVDFTS